jgi:transposase
VLEVPVYKGKGRSGKNQQPVRTHYEISGNLSTPLEKRDEATAKQLGLFILVTNDIDGSLSMADMLSTYKSQQAVEKGFRSLKSPDFLTSAFYLKKLERIEALLMVMTTCLIVYAALEHTIREQLKAQDEYFPDMKKKPTQTLLLNIKDRQAIIIKILGINYQQIYS